MDLLILQKMGLEEIFDTKLLVRSETLKAHTIQKILTKPENKTGKVPAIKNPAQTFLLFQSLDKFELPKKSKKWNPI